MSAAISLFDIIKPYCRTMGHPNQDMVVFNNEQRDDYIKKYIGISDLYTSVYNFSELDDFGLPLRQSAIVDKIFFDFDTEHWLDDIKKVHKWCQKYDILHRSHFSGNGGHVFIFLANQIINKKMAVRNFQNHLNNKLNTSIDKKIRGDIARIFRYLNTYNFKGRRWCIPIPPEALNSNKDESWFLKQATTQQFHNAWSGSKLLNINKWDIDEDLYSDGDMMEFNISKIDEQINIEYPEFPPCVKSWLSTPTLSGDGKYLLSLFLKDQYYVDPFDSNQIRSIMQQTLNTEEYGHYFGRKPKRHHEGHNGIKFRSLMKKDYYMPNCDVIRTKGYCPEDCGRFHPIYDKEI